MANNYVISQTKESVLQTMFNRYNNITQNITLAGEAVENSTGEKTTLPRSNFQSIYQQNVDFDNSSLVPRLITVVDLQNAINYLENRMSANCNCTMINAKCQTCQQQCSSDNGNCDSSCQSCQYVRDIIDTSNPTYACQTLTCQTIATTKSCEVCQSCQICQKDDGQVSCQSCQLFSCQTLRCEYAKPQCVCQTCQTNCSQCSCQSYGQYTSCQSQCK